MTEGLTPRLNILTDEVVATRGPDNRNLTDILNELQTANNGLSVLEVLQTDAFLLLQRLVNIPDEPGLPFGTSSWPVANYELWAELLAQFNLRTSGLPDASAAAASYLPELNNLGLRLSSISQSLDNLEDYVLQVRTGITSLVANTAATNVLLSQLIECLCPDGPPDPGQARPACIDPTAVQATGWADIGVLDFGGLGNRRVVVPIFPQPIGETGIVTLVNPGGLRRKYKFPSQGLWNMRLGVNLDGATSLPVVRWNGQQLTSDPNDTWPPLASIVTLPLSIGADGEECDGAFANSFNSSSAFEPGDEPVEYFFLFPEGDEPFEFGRVWLDLGGVG